MLEWNSIGWSGTDVSFEPNYTPQTCYSMTIARGALNVRVSVCICQNIIEYVAPRKVVLAHEMYEMFRIVFFSNMFILRP